MNERRWIILILLAIYAFGTCVLTVYHAFNFSKYIHVKGDELFNYVGFLLISSLLFQGLVWMITKTLRWKTVVMATIGNVIISFILGFGILMIAGLSGIPRHLIFIYGGCFMTFFCVTTIAQTRKL